jgi:2-amino-4-hydroxy-6-hydroxymethyldihydropteridine diphosphokinase
VTTLADDVLVIGLGGNLGGDAAILERFRRAREAFERVGATRAAPLYRTGPIGPAQPDFLNSAVQVRYLDSPAQLIASVLELERALGRDRRDELRGGPRAIDLDVLVWGPRVFDSTYLVVPHPRLAERRFALAPLAELLGDAAVLPGTQSPLRDLLERVTGQRIELVTADW